VTYNMKKQVLQFAAALGIFIVATAMLLFLPSFSVMYLPVCLALFTALNLSSGRWQNVLLLVVSFIAVTILSGSLIFSLLCVLLPFVFSAVSVFFYRKSSPEKSLTLVYGLANALFLAGMIFFAKDELGGLDGFFAQMTDIFNQNLDLFIQQGLIDLSLKDAYLAQLELILQQLKLMAPSMLFVFSAVSGYITIWIAWLFSKLLKAAFILKPTFSRLKCNTVTSGMTILVCLLSIFIKDGIFGVALDNAFAIFSFLLCACTASLADYWLKTKNWATIVRAIIVLFLLSNYSGSIISLLMCMIAITDARADFRRIDQEEI